MLEKVILLNGKEVSWEEFSRWSSIKQRNNLIPKSDEIRETLRNNRLGQKYSQETREKISHALLNIPPHEREIINAKNKATRARIALKKAGKVKRVTTENKNKGEFVCPYGTFPTRALAAEAAKAAGLEYAVSKLRDRTKNDPKNYYFKKNKTE